MKTENTKRNSSLELLRIIASLGVIILHYNSFANDFIEDESLISYYIDLTNCLFICSVNVFILISAFFLSNTNRRKLSKILELIFQFTIFRLGYYVIKTVFDKKGIDFDTLVNLMLPVNYFIVLYSVLYVISPYLNVLISGLNEKAIKHWIVLIVSLFSIETWGVDILSGISNKTYNGLSTVGLWGSQKGFSIVNFVLLYFIGAYIRRNYEKIVKLNGKKIILILLSDLAILYSMLLISRYIKLDIPVFNYNNPFIIAFAVLALLLFMKINIESTIVNELAKASFTCFIIHSSFLPFMHIEDVIESSVYIVLLHQFVVVIGLFTISYIIYRAYAFCLRPICKLVYAYMPNVNSSKNIV